MLLGSALRTAAWSAGVGAGAWGVWWALVLRRAMRSSKPRGPEWLAKALSGVLYNFGCWYLNFTHNSEDTIRAGLWDEDKQYLMVWHPHGAFTIAALYFVSYWWASNYLPKRGKGFCAVAPLLLRVPGLAEFLLLSHARSVDSKTFNKLLASGATVAVQPGGLLEQVS